MKAYDIIFLEEAQLLLAEYFETSVYDLGITLEKAWKSFALSNYSQKISCGYPFETFGKSGSEIAFDLHCMPKQQLSFSQTKSIEFQLGSLIAYYQWYRDIPFISIYRKININQLFEKLQQNPREGTLAFCESLDIMMRDTDKKTLLKIRRNEIGISQKKLSEAAGIPLRTIQQYEQRQKNINKAQIKYVLSLAKALVCRPEELLEIE